MELCSKKNDVTLYKKGGDKNVIKNATVKTKDGKAYVTKENGYIAIYKMSMLDSRSGRIDGGILYSDNENESDELLANDAPITPLDDEIIEIKKDLNNFRNARSGGYFLQALGIGLTVAGSFMLIKDANNEDFTGSSGGSTLAAIGGGLSLVGFLITWSAGDKINYDNDIAKYKKKKAEE